MPKVAKRSKRVKPKPAKVPLNRDEKSLHSVNIGASNAPKWNRLRDRLSFKSDETFIAHLLKTLEDSLSQTAAARKVIQAIDVKDVERPARNELSEKETSNVSTDSISPSKHRRSHEMKSILGETDDSNRKQEEDNLHRKNDATNAESPVLLSSDHSAEIKIVSSILVNHEIASNDGGLVKHRNRGNASSFVSNLCAAPVPVAPIVVQPNSESEKSSDAGISEDSKKFPKLRNFVKKKIPSRNQTGKQSDAAKEKNSPNKSNFRSKSRSRADAKENESGNSSFKVCNDCNQRHPGNACFLHHPVKKIKDAISYEDWIKEDVFVHSNSVCDSGEELNFSKCSLPECLELKLIESSHGYSVIARSQIPQFTEFGPLIGERIEMQDIPDDCNMQSIWEVQNCDGKQLYLSTQNLNLSNWLSYIRPAPSIEARNVIIVTHDSQLYFVTLSTITIGSELLYWIDSSTKAWNDKKLNKKKCGGCNLKFDHNFYYRLHCQIFHDLDRSLTVRKYHCKVCGAAVLGKQNIVKHAVELHKGKGAYQCPFCKKFFLRLNYLEMHKTYGCSSNPQRSRPLCDFCGRKFCQPQKLKVHIKRMHGEFQCMKCLRVLGSRAALQRHNKEVHHKSERDSISCRQCGKSFQNKSNLKIHMLTHSGIKPFRCSLGDCLSAFTTKQCLQLHYKKFHGLSDEHMPTINRTVEYTFNAYAGENMSDVNPDSPQSYENSDSRPQSPASPLSQAQDSSFSRSTLIVDSASVDNNSRDSSNDMLENNQDDYCDSANSSGVIIKSSRRWSVEETEIQSEAKDYSVMPMNVESEEPEVEPKVLYPYTRTESSNASLLVEAAIDAVEKVINVNHPPIHFSTSHDPTDLSSGLEHEENGHRSMNSPSPVHVPQFGLSSHPESHSNSLEISISSAYQGGISPPHYGAPYSLQLSPVDVVNVAEQGESYLRKVDDISGDEAENAVQNLCLSSKDRLQIDILAYKPYSDSLEEKSNLKQYENRDSRLQFLKHYSPLEDRSKYEGLDDRLISADDRLSLFKQYELLDERSPTLLKQYDVMEERSSLYKLYDNVTEDRTSLMNFEPLESMDMSRCSGIGHIYSNLQVSPPKYPRPLYGTNPSHSYSDVLRVVNLHSQSVDLSLSRPATSNLIPSSPTYQSYPLSPTLPTYLTPRSALSPTYHPYSSYY